MSNIPTICCPVCGAGLRVTTCVSKTGKVALVLVCPKDGRDFRAFINNREYVQRVIDSLEPAKSPAKAYGISRRATQRDVTEFLDYVKGTQGMTAALATRPEGKPVRNTGKVQQRWSGRVAQTTSIMAAQVLKGNLEPKELTHAEREHLLKICNLADKI